jgi:hypothetical protein
MNCRVAVTWHTRDALPDSKVQWGTKSTALTNTAAAVFDTSYSSSAMCGVPANYEVREINSSHENVIVITIAGVSSRVQLTTGSS